MQQENHAVNRHKSVVVIGLVALALPALCGDALKDGFDFEAFRRPAAVRTPGLFWVWNDRLERDVLFAQMDDMVRHGLRSVCIHPYPARFQPASCPAAMSPDYLTPEYMRVVGEVVDRAEKLGMDVWLYDEGGWPSGGACGKVYASNPRDFARRWKMLTPTGVVDVVDRPNAKALAPYPSVIEKGVTEAFLKSTHELWQKAVGRHFGKTVTCAFTDEPAMPQDRRWMNPPRIGWCADFAEEFQARKGYDLRPHLAGIIGRGEFAEEDKRRRIDFFDVASELFVERYLRTVRKWLNARGVGSGGHLDGDDEFVDVITHGHGHHLRALREMDTPGVDVIWRQLFPGRKGGQRPFPKYASSAAHQNGTTDVLAEAFAVYGDGTTPQEMKWLVDYLLVRGVNRFVFSAMPLYSGGRRMETDGGVRFGPDDPRWDAMAGFFGYVARCSAALAQGRPQAKTAVLYDVRAVWAGGAEAEEAVRLHEETSAKLLARQCDFDFVDDDQLAVAETAEANGRVVLSVGRMTYESLVLPTSKRMLPEAKRRVETFARRGGKVVYGDDVAGIEPVCEVSGKGASSIRVLKRVCGKTSVYFLVNESLEEQAVEISFAEKGTVVRLDPGDASVRAVGMRDGRVTERFDPCGSALFLVGGDLPPAESAPARGGEIALRLEDGWKLRRLERRAFGAEHYEITNFGTDEPEQSVRLGDWRETLGRTYCGTAVYRNAFDAGDLRLCELDLGEVGHVCRVRLNGRELEPRFFGPFRWPVELAKGRNILEVTVSSSLAPITSDNESRQAFYRQHPPACSYESRYADYIESGCASGLMGPVVLRRLASSESL